MTMLVQPQRIRPGIWRGLQALAVVLTACLTGCGSSPPVSFYGLEPMPVSGEEAQAPEVVVGLGPLRFPDYLKRPQIVTRAQGTQVEIAEFDRWMEPVDAMFQRVLVMNLDGLLEGVSVVAFPFGAGLVDVDYRVLASINRFEVGPGGGALLDVQWGISSSEGESITRAVRRSYEATAADPGDYASIVVALNDTLDQLSRDIAGTLRGLPSG